MIVIIVSQLQNAHHPEVVRRFMVERFTNERWVKPRGRQLLCIALSILNLIGIPPHKTRLKNQELLWN